MKKDVRLKWVNRYINSLYTQSNHSNPYIRMNEDKCLSYTSELTANTLIRFVVCEGLSESSNDAKIKLLVFVAQLLILFFVGI